MRQTSLASGDGRKFPLPPSTIPIWYLCDRCTGPVYFHTYQSQALLNCFGQVMPIFRKRQHLNFSSLDISISKSLVQTLEFGVNAEAFDCADCSGLTGLIGCWGDGFIKFAPP